MKSFSRGLVALSLVFFGGDATFEKPFSQAAERSPSTSQVSSPESKKKTTPPSDVFTGNPPMELLVDGSELTFYSRAPSTSVSTNRPLTIKDGYLYIVDSSDTPIKKIS